MRIVTHFEPEHLRAPGRMDRRTKGRPMNAPSPPAMFQRASRALNALLTQLHTIAPTELPIVPTASAIEAVQHDCRQVVIAAAAFVRARMADVEYSTGADMEADLADWITAAFDEQCDPMFAAATRALSDAAPPTMASRPGLHGACP